MIKVDLITGFLGSGKTTFIIQYAKHLVEAGEKVTVIVNDYGAINVDRLLLDTELKDSCHLEMVIGGDVCCSRRRLKTKLISAAIDKYTRVIIEPSGIFDTDDFFDLIFDSPLDKWYQIGNVISLLDSKIDFDMSYESKYILCSQVAKAGKIVLNKIEDMTDDEIANLKTSIISFINENLEIFKCTRRVVSLFEWKNNDLSNEEFSELLDAGYFSGEMIKLPISKENSFNSLFYFHVETDPKKIKETISELFKCKECGNIIRIKGYLRIGQSTTFLEINATANDVNVKPSPVGQELFIVIGENLNSELIGSFWDSYNRTL